MQDGHTDDIPAVPKHFLHEDLDEPAPVQDEDMGEEDIEAPYQYVAPNERFLMEHFTSHYNAFADAVKQNINEPFTTDQLIMLHRTYSGVWGQGRV